MAWFFSLHICFALECFASILGTLLLLPGNEIRLVTVVDKYFKAHSNHRQLHLCERSYFRHKVFLCICIFASAQQGQGGTRNFLSDNFPGAGQGGEEAPCGGGSVCYEWRPEVRGSLCLGGRLGLAVAVERGERSEGSACASAARPSWPSSHRHDPAPPIELSLRRRPVVEGQGYGVVVAV